MSITGETPRNPVILLAQNEIWEFIQLKKKEPYKSTQSIDRILNNS